MVVAKEGQTDSPPHVEAWLPGRQPVFHGRHVSQQLAVVLKIIRLQYSQSGYSHIGSCYN